MLRAAYKSHHLRGSGEVRLDQVSRQRQRLVRLLQQLRFGSIHNLHLSAGDPLFEPSPRIIRLRKPGACHALRPQETQRTFVLKREWIELFHDMDSIGTGTILRIDVMHGLPASYEFEDLIAV